MTKFVNEHYVTIRNNTNDKDFFGKGLEIVLESI